MKLKILQWNIWYQEKAENIIALIREANPDIVCLQELTINSRYNNYQDVPEMISKGIGFDYTFSIAHQSGEWLVQGNGIFSRYPIIQKKDFFVAEEKDWDDYADEGRVCVVAELALEKAKTLLLATTHLSYTHRFIENVAKTQEVERLISFFGQHTENFVFTGDLNLAPDSKSIKWIERYLKHSGPDYTKPTWTTKPFSYNGFEEDKLRWRLDYVFATSDIVVLSSEIIQTNYSDHLPILVEIEL